MTLLFDPGRIKRGLKPRETAGPVLEAGHRYELKITGKSDGWLSDDFQRSFVVGPPDDTPIDPKTWALHAPHPETRNPLVVDTHEPLDSAMMERRLLVLDPTNGRIEGATKLKSDGRVWEFRPERAWKPGRYRLSVPRLLEDLAGNQVGRRFEVDMLEPIPSGPTGAETVDLPFEVGDSSHAVDGAAVGVRN